LLKITLILTILIIGQSMITCKNLLLSMEDKNHKIDNKKGNQLS